MESLQTTNEKASLTRRKFVGLATASVVSLFAGQILISKENQKKKKPQQNLSRMIGLTTGSLNHQREQGTLTLLTLPKFFRDELGMQMIDVNTRWFKSFDKTYLQKVKETAHDANCFFSNLKVNHKFGDLYSKKVEAQKEAMKQAQLMVDTAKTIGAKWIRFTVPQPSTTIINNNNNNNKGIKLAAHSKLAAYAQTQDVQLLVENNGWMRSTPSGVTQVVKTIGNNAAAAPDTGNWDDDVRYKGLAKTFPSAVTCDFKVFELNKANQHKRYDIKRCFDIGWKAGFRGPWAIEHWHKDLKTFATETTFLRDQLKQWMKAV